MFNEDQTTTQWVMSMKGSRAEMAIIPLEYKKIPIMKFTDSARFYSNLEHKKVAILLIQNNYVVAASYVE